MGMGTFGHHGQVDASGLAGKAAGARGVPGREGQIPTRTEVANAAWAWIAARSGLKHAVARDFLDASAEMQWRMPDCRDLTSETLLPTWASEMQSCSTQAASQLQLHLAPLANWGAGERS